jgi:hypothetical protein
MKILAGFAFAALMAVSASAGTVDISVLCGAVTNATPATPTTGSYLCPTYASLGIGGGATLASEFISYNSDYSIPGPNGATVVANWSIFAAGGSPVQYATDTITSTGTSLGSNPGVCSSTGNAVNSAQLLNGAVVPTGCYNTIGSPYGQVSINYTQTVTAGAATGDSVSVYVVFDYNTSSAAPEPVSMLLMGGGLLGLSIIGRKRFARK